MLNILLTFIVSITNENLLIIDKPVGLVVHPGAGTKNNTLMNGLMALQESGAITLSNVRGDERLGIERRLINAVLGIYSTTFT